MKHLIKEILFGDSQISEYLKISTPDEIQERVFLEAAGEVIDVSSHQWLLCIEPVVFGVWINNQVPGSLILGDRCKIYFHDSLVKNISFEKKSSAVVDLTLFDWIRETSGTLLLFKVLHSNIFHLNSIRRYLLFSRYYKKNGLTFSKFKSFVAAYSYPRRIRLVSFRAHNYYNIFPMDLVGDISGANRFVFGLRHTNVTLGKILETRRLVVSEVGFQFKDVIYELGKHHSGNPPSLPSLPFDVVKTGTFDFYVPAWVESYKEIRILETKNMGSHMLLWGEVIGEAVLNAKCDHLFLIHFLHYLWQKKGGHRFRIV
jgi:hypothetical protein